MNARVQNYLSINNLEIYTDNSLNLERARSKLRLINYESFKEMNSIYKRLGDYIEVVEERNRDLSVTLSQGICNLKYFQDPRQVAENSAADKIVRKGWFAYNRATTRNGDKVSIAYRDGEDCTVSASYLTFKIKDENLLNPYFLMMWFKRPEFDRYARFKSHGSAHEYFEWEEMCEVMLPVPPIEEQRKIVAEYQVVERRIENNRRLIATLEATAQTIYRKMFVDNIDHNNLPDGWRIGTIGDLFTLQRGHDLPAQNRVSGKYPIYASTGINGYHTEYRVEAPCVVTGRSGSIGIVNYVTTDFWPLNTTLFVKECENSSMEYAFFKLKELELDKLVVGFAAVPTLNRNDVHMIKCAVPPRDYIREFSGIVYSMFEYIDNLNKDNVILNHTLSLLLSKLSNL